MTSKKHLLLALVLSFLSACTRSPHSAPWLNNETLEPMSMEESDGTPNPAEPPTRDPDEPIVSPTPDPPHNVPGGLLGSEQYTVQSGDTIASIAQEHDLPPELIIEVNQLQNPHDLEIGQVLTIPPENFEDTGPSFKVIPDSELVYGPYSATFDIAAFVSERGGYLASYTEVVDEQVTTGAEVVQRVADDYSVNPRLLLAVLEHQSGWVTGGSGNEYPIGHQNSQYAKLYRQLAWAADQLNWGYYIWRVNGVGSWQLPDSVNVPVNPTINAGTAGVQHFFAKLLPHAQWQTAVTKQGLFNTYQQLFGYPFDYAFEPILPGDLSQPALSLPFEEGVVWAFTGGPHGGWDSGSAWAALDFAPPPGNNGCSQSDEWVVASADGVIVRSDHGAVVQSLDGDEYAQTGWALLYMHIESRDRVDVGTYLNAGDRVGHPSCEGGISSGTHLHLARRYNGEWIPADQDLPLNLDGWISGGAGAIYQGTLEKGDQVIYANERRTDENLLER